MDAKTADSFAEGLKECYVLEVYWKQSVRVVMYAKTKVHGNTDSTGYTSRRTIVEKTQGL